MDAFRRILADEGAAGYFRGLGPSVQRAAVINGCGIASYDHTKQMTLKLTGQAEGLVSQVVGALVSGLVSAMVSTPFDVVKTRIMNQPVGAKLYSGACRPPAHAGRGGEEPGGHSRARRCVPGARY